MPHRCRFCKSPSVHRVFAANRKLKLRKVELFACTNSGFGHHGNIIRCDQCGIYYVDEKVSQKAISTYYEVAKDPLYFKEQPARKRTFLRHLAKVDRTVRQKGKLLDIGTNTGLFVRLALDDGWQVSGVEPNKWAVEFAKKNYSVDLIAKPFTKDIFPHANFDAITMWDVIEHFTDPVSEIAAVYSLLKPGGVFVFTTVDPESLLAKVMGTSWPWYMEMHKVFFTQDCARNYLKKAGFKNILFKPHFRFLSAGYLASRLLAINATMANIIGKVLAALGLSKMIVPYYANDLYDCYAFK